LPPIQILILLPLRCLLTQCIKTEFHCLIALHLTPFEEQIIFSFETLFS